MSAGPSATSRPSKCGSAWTTAIAGWRSEPASRPAPAFISTFAVKAGGGAGVPAAEIETHRADAADAAPTPQALVTKTATAYDPSASAAWSKEALLSTLDRASHFFGYDEVDTPARPSTDWNLDPAALDDIHSDRLVFDVYVSDTGEVIGCTVREPATLSDSERDSITSRLRGTVLTPALRSGRPVSSTRTIEISVVASG